MPAAVISGSSVVRVVVVSSETGEFQDILSVEEPLEIRIGLPGSNRAISITMRTPGADLELAAGFLFTEGIVDHHEQIANIRHCGFSGKNKDLQNTVVVELANGVEIDFKHLERNFYTT